MDLKKVRCEDLDWVHLAEDRDRWTALMKMSIETCVP
jgi:hypothetical protein